MGCGGPCVRGERGSEVFSVCVRRPFFLSRYRRRRSFPWQAEFFFYNVAEQDYFTITSTIVSTKHITQGKENIRLISAAA
jgi:hypothetical protein